MKKLIDELQWYGESLEGEQTIFDWVSTLVKMKERWVRHTLPLLQSESGFMLDAVGQTIQCGDTVLYLRPTNQMQVGDVHIRADAEVTVEPVVFVVEQSEYELDGVWSIQGRTKDTWQTVTVTGGCVPHHRLYKLA